MADTKLNGKPKRKVCIPDSKGDPSVPPPMISLPVGGRNGLQGKFVWKVELGAKRNYARLGERLARCDDSIEMGRTGWG